MTNPLGGQQGLEARRLMCIKPLDVISFIGWGKLKRSEYGTAGLEVHQRQKYGLSSFVLVIGTH